jgi:hypothetical protein
LNLSRQSLGARGGPGDRVFAGPESAYLTGETIEINGGLLMR